MLLMQHPLQAVLVNSGDRGRALSVHADSLLVRGDTWSLSEGGIQGGQRGASTSQESQAFGEVEACPPSKEPCEEVPAS